MGDAKAPHATEVALYLNLSRSRVALYPLPKATSSVVALPSELNKLVEEDILQPCVPGSLIKRFVALAAFCLIS